MNDVINMMPVTFQNKATEFISIWSSLSKGNHLPYKKDFSPVAFIKMARDLALFENILPDGVVFRMMSAAIDELTPIQYTGKNIYDLFDVSSLENFSPPYVASVDHKCGIYHQLNFEYTDGYTFNMDCLMLPLLNNAGDVQYWVALLCTTEQPDYFKIESKIFKRHNLVSDFYYIDLGHGKP